MQASSSVSVVEGTRTNEWQLASQRESVAIEMQLQRVFTAVLKAAGQEGYASADPLPKELLNAESVQASWQRWFQDVKNHRYQFTAGSGNPSVRKGKSEADLEREYTEILGKAYRSGGYSDAQTFVKGLSQQELQVLQQVQHLADPIEPHTLSQEGALNLLLPPDAHVDQNDDGITSVGIAQTLRFPDSRTPATVRDAWESASATVSEDQRMTYVLMLARGNPLSSIGDQASQPIPSTAEAFLAKANAWLDYLDYFKNQLPMEQYQRDHSFWKAFRDGLQFRIAALH